MKQAVNPVIQNDIMRYKKNKLGANLALLGLAFGCVYFIVLYAQVKNGNYYYKWPIAIDVIYNLFFMLFAFLLSEQVKNYDSKLFWLQMVLGAMQIIRIFWLPLAGVTQTAYTVLADVEFKQAVLKTGTFMALVISLACSGACIIASGIIGLLRSKKVADFTAKVESGELDIDAELKKEEAPAGGEANA